MKIYILFILTGLFTLSSCNDYLDIEPKGQIIANTLEDYEFLSSANDFNSIIGFSPFWLSDDLISNVPLNGTNLTAAYLWEDYLYNETENDELWNSEYKKIFIANTILQGVDELGENNGLANQLRAEALFQRSYALFTLVNVYAKHYNVNTAGTDLGVPIFTTPNLEQEDYVRSTVQEVYDLIISDLESTVNNLADEQSNRNRPDKAAGHGLLARIYLYKGEFDKAKAAAEDALSYNDTFFDLRVNAFSAFNFSAYSEAYIEKTLLSASFLVLSISQETRDMVFDDPADLRFSQNFLPFASPVGFAFRGFILSFGGLSTPEMYLIKAEADARNGNIAAALESINEIRRYRFLEANYNPIVEADVTDIFELVMKERRKELMFKGHRWFDVKRLNAEGKWNLDLVRKDVDGNVLATLPANDNKSVIAIPRNIIFEYNPDLQQNPR